MTTTTKQKEAIFSWDQGPVCVTAGPGSGKTSVLVERFRWLISEKKVNPQKILVVTFTKKAALQLVERLNASDESYKSYRQGSSRTSISTIDSFCASLLREYAFETGLDPNFSVMDERETKIEQERVIHKVLDRSHIADPSAVKHFLRNFSGDNIEDNLAQMHEKICNSNKQPFTQLSDPEPILKEMIVEFKNATEENKLPALAEEIKWLQDAIQTQDLDYAHCLDNLDKRLRLHSNLRNLKPLRDIYKKDFRPVIVSAANYNSRKWLIKILEEIDQSFQQWKRANSKCDYSDLGRYAVQLLEKNPHLSKRFDHILVDEYQDISPVQNRLIQLLGGRKDSASTPYVVGDVNQSIYGFRYADPGLFRNFRKMADDNGHRIDLPDNFRSRSDILLATEIFLGNAAGIDPRTLHSKRIFPKKSIPSVEVLLTYGDALADINHREGRFLAARVLKLKSELKLHTDNPEERYRKPNWSDFAILGRTHNILEPIAKAFLSVGIPITAAGRGLFDTTEVRDLINLLHVLVNPRDEIRFASVLRSPLVGVSDETLLILKTADINLVQAFTNATTQTELDPIPLFAEIRSADLNRLEQFQGWFTNFRFARDEVSIDILLSRVMNETGYEAYLLSQSTGAHQIANVRKFLDIVRAQAKTKEFGFDSLVLYIEKMRAVNPGESSAPALDQSVDAVQLMTIHQSKGLEFPVVVIPSLQSEIRSSKEDATFSPKHGIGAKWKEPTTKFPRDSYSNPCPECDDASRKTREDIRRQRLEEGNRLLYVAMTRAEEHLVLSSRVNKTGKKKEWKVSGWLKILKKACDSASKNSSEMFPGNPDNELRVETLGNLTFRIFRTDCDPVINPRPSTSAESPVEWTQAVQRPLDHSDSIATVTDVHQFYTCPRHYYLSRYLGFPEDHQPNSQVQILATEINKDHTVQRKRLNSTDLGLRVHEVLAGTAQPDPSEKEVIKLVQRFHKSDLGQRVPTNANREQSLIFDVGGHLLSCKIDLWFDDSDNKRFLVDYKTDQINKLQIAQRKLRYELQLQLYAHALEQATGRTPDHAELYFLQPDEIVKVDISPKKQRNAARIVDKFFEAQSNLNFPPEEGEQCLQCPYYQGLCPVKPFTAED